MPSRFPISAQVVINEIMYDFEGSDDNHEWIEIKNVGAQSVDFTNWRFEEGGTKHTLTLKQGDINIAGGSYAVIADNTDQFLTDYPGFLGILIDSSFTLSNTGEKITLLETKDGPVINEVTYSSEWGAAGNGRTLQKKNGEFAEGPISGTPGRENEFPFIPTPTSTPTPTPKPTVTPKPTTTPKPTATPKPTPMMLTRSPTTSSIKVSQNLAGESATPKETDKQTNFSQKSLGQILGEENEASLTANFTDQLESTGSLAPNQPLKDTASSSRKIPPQLFFILGGVSIIIGGSLIYFSKLRKSSNIC